MKTTLLKAVILVFALSTCFMSCKDEEETQINSFKYNQKEADIGTALGMAFGQWDVNGVYGINMEFFEKTFTIHYVGGYPDSVSGKGDVLFLTFLSNKETEITPGEYNVKPASAASTAFSIDGEEATGLVVSYDAAIDDEPPLIDITSGKVTVAKNGEEYEFTFNLNTNINTTITGYYKGKPVIYNDKKKKSAGNRTWFPH